MLHLHVKYNLLSLLPLTAFYDQQTYFMILMTHQITTHKYFVIVKFFSQNIDSSIDLESGKNHQLSLMNIHDQICPNKQIYHPWQCPLVPRNMHF